MPDWWCASPSYTLHGPFARISANNYCLLGMLLATVRGLPHKVRLVKPNFGNLNIGAVGAAIGDDTNGLQRRWLWHFSQYSVGFFKAVKWQAYILPGFSHVKGSLIIMPRQQCSRCPQMHEIALIVAADFDRYPSAFCRWLRFEVVGELDETTVVLKAYCAGHMGKGRVTLLDKADLSL